MTGNITKEYSIIKKCYFKTCKMMNINEMLQEIVKNCVKIKEARQKLNTNEVKTNH